MVSALDLEPPWVHFLCHSLKKDIRGGVHLQEHHIFPPKTYSFAAPKKVLREKKKTSLGVFNNPLLKYRRQFFIRNHILFLNYRNHFYIFFLSRPLASGTLSYSLFFPTPFHIYIDLRIHTGKQCPHNRDYAQSYARRWRISKCINFRSKD